MLAQLGASEESDTRDASRDASRWVFSVKAKERCGGGEMELRAQTTESAETKEPLVDLLFSATQTKCAEARDALSLMWHFSILFPH